MASKRVRYSSRNEAQVLDFLELGRSTTLQMDHMYYDEEKDVYVLTSHPFMTEEKAELYLKKLESYFPDSIITINQDRESRYYIYWDIVELTDQQVKLMIRENKVEPFSSKPGFHSNKSKKDADYILAQLKMTDMPLSNVYRSRANNAYYISSSFFASEKIERCYAYQQKFNDAFGPGCAEVQIDFADRGFVLLDPGTLNKQQFAAFIAEHKTGIFSNSAEQDNTQDDTLDETVDDAAEEEPLSEAHQKAIQILNILRHTQYPMDMVFKDKKTGKVMIVSAVFHRQEGAEGYVEIFNTYFGSQAASLIKDSQDRFSVYLDPTQVEVAALKQLTEDFNREIFPKVKREQMGKNRKPLRDRQRPKRIKF